MNQQLRETIQTSCSQNVKPGLRLCRPYIRVTAPDGSLDVPDKVVVRCNPFHYESLRFAFEQVFGPAQANTSSPYFGGHYEQETVVR